MATTIINKVDLHNEGGNAYVAGVAWDDSPYPLCSWSHRYWTEGYQEARRFYPEGSTELAELRSLYKKAA